MICFRILKASAPRCVGSVFAVFVRHAVGGLRRKPIRVIGPSNPSTESPQKQDERPHEGKATPRYEKLGHNDGLLVFINYTNKLVFREIFMQIGVSHKQHLFLSMSAITKVKSRKQREKHGLILLEGNRLIQSALQAGAVAEQIFFSLEENLEGLPLHLVGDNRLYKVLYKSLQTWTDVTSSPGVLGVFKLPKYGSLNTQQSQRLPVTVVCDNVKDPGNLGAILRCVVAAGCHKILLTKGCIDPWEPKVLRAGAGAHFRIDLECNIGWERVTNYVSCNSSVFLADTPEPSTPDTRASLANESNEKQLDEGNHVIEPPLPDSKLNIFPMPSIQHEHYHRVQYFKGSDVVLVVGGETEGLGAAAHRFACNHGGQKITIPLYNHVESLNVAVAVGILVFEMQRQYREHQNQSAG